MKITDAVYVRFTLDFLRTRMDELTSTDGFCREFTSVTWRTYKGNYFKVPLTTLFNLLITKLVPMSAIDDVEFDADKL